MLMGIVAFILLFFVFLSVLRTHNGPELPPLHDGVNIELFSAMITYLLFTAVIVERFLEIIIGAERERLKQPLLQATHIAKETLDKANDTRRSADYEKLLTCKSKLELFREETRQKTLRAGFIIGLIAAICGVAVLRPIFDTSEFPNWQLGLFWALDCVLTAGIVSGGSSGISKLNNVIISHLNKSKEQSSIKTQQTII